MSPTSLPGEKLSAKTKLFVLTEVVYTDDQKDLIVVEIQVHVRV